MNGTAIAGLHHDQVVGLIKEGGLRVTLTLGPPTDDSSSTASTPQKVSGRMKQRLGEMRGEVELMRPFRREEVGELVGSPRNKRWGDGVFGY